MHVHRYEPGVIYTFDYYDSFFRPGSFTLDLKVKRIDLCPILGEQPLVLTMAKTSDTGEYLWKFEIWHERSVSDDSPLLSTARIPSGGRGGDVVSSHGEGGISPTARINSSSAVDQKRCETPETLEASRHFAGIPLLPDEVGGVATTPVPPASPVDAPKGFRVRRSFMLHAFDGI